MDSAINNRRQKARKYEVRICSVCGKSFNVRCDSKTRMCSRECVAREATSKIPVEEKFMSRVLKTDNCWIWLGFKDKLGYGRFTFNRKTYPAHRFSCILAGKPIPNNLFACHKCDNPSCVNPDHIFPGTQADNVHDAISKGRMMQKGEDNCYSKLKNEDILEIREIYKNGSLCKAELARKFHIDKSHVRRIVSRELWAHI